MNTLTIDNFETVRIKSLEAFNVLGIPSAKNENYKYTNLSQLLKSEDLLKSVSTTGLNKANVFSQLPFLKNSLHIILENGTWNDELNKNNISQKGITLCNLSEAEENETVKNHFANYIDLKNHSFAALNTAQMQDGVFIGIDSKVELSSPLFIVNVATGNNSVSHPRVLFVGGKSSKAAVCFITINVSDTGKTFTNTVHEIVALENSNLEFDFFQMDGSEATHISHTYTYQKRDSVFSINTITLGGKLVRNNLNMMLDDENCQTHLNGLYIGNKKQHIDNQTSVYHAKPNCQSNELYKGILDDESTGVFNGRIHVFKDAQKTNAFQSNKNVLLSDKANMYSKPQLEIYADDVKCSHGATTGQLDDDALFYLRTRGINAHNAKALLNFAFAGDVIEKVSIPELKEYLLRLIAQKLHTNIEFEIFD